MAHPFLVKPDTKVKLSDHDPDERGGLKKGDPEVKQRLRDSRRMMSECQERMYAEGKQSLLIVLQAMDAGGKDGTINHVMRGLNPQACQIRSFKQPSALELQHDFLWRIHEWTPRKGHIVVFNRSHYEDVLVVRVHNIVPKAVWRKRYEHINNFEKLLHDGGTRIIKFFLHISKDEQKQRFEQRIANPAKHWKLSPADNKERKLWGEYTKAYEEALARCSTDYAPWYVIPANRKWYRNLVIAEILAQTLNDMDPQWPEPVVDVSKLVIED